MLTWDRREGRHEPDDGWRFAIRPHYSPNREIVEHFFLVAYKEAPENQYKREQFETHPDTFVTEKDARDAAERWQRPAP